MKDTVLISSLPRVDLHRHLEGAVRLQTVLDLARQHNLRIPTDRIEELRELITISQPTSDIVLLFPKFDLLRISFVDIDAIRRITRECLEDASLEGLDYVELRFSPAFMAELHGLDPFSVTAAICEEWQEVSRQQDMISRLIVILSRTYGPERCDIELECALKHQTAGIVGIDLAGDEARHPARDFAKHFRTAQEMGLFRTAHAGEFAGAGSVYETIDLLHPDRLGHAVHAADDPHVMEMIEKAGIAIECCPTSNYLTCSVRDLREHPLPVFLRNGILATLNTDDPSLMGELVLEDEYRIAREKIELSPGELEIVQRNGIQAAFLSNEEKTRILEKCQHRI